VRSMGVRGFDQAQPARSERALQVVFEMNVTKKRMRARAEKCLVSATKCGKVDAGGAAPREWCLASSHLYVMYGAPSSTRIKRSY
jgi:hypothetical protein